jgi:hypothetical protein
VCKGQPHPRFSQYLIGRFGFTSPRFNQLYFSVLLAITQYGTTNFSDLITACKLVDLMPHKCIYFSSRFLVLLSVLIRGPLFHFCDSSKFQVVFKYTAWHQYIYMLMPISLTRCTVCLFLLLFRYRILLVGTQFQYTATRIQWLETVATILAETKQPPACILLNNYGHF